MKQPIDIWNALQRKEKVTIEEVALICFGVDVSDYIETVCYHLPRYRTAKATCDGTAILTLQTLYNMVYPIIAMKVFDKEKRYSNRLVSKIKYKCSPIQYKVELNIPKQIGEFTIRYSSELVYYGE